MLDWWIIISNPHVRKVVIISRFMNRELNTL